MFLLKLLALASGHPEFLAKTVLVKNNDVDTAFKLLDRILRQEGVFERFRREQHYERPCKQRQRTSTELAMRVYNAEMRRKIEFVLCKNRPDAWPR